MNVITHLFQSIWR